jgi:hypothetical protein
MARRILQALIIGVAAGVLAIPALAQNTRPYKEGAVTELTYVKIKPGRFDDYMRFLDTDYKKLMEAEKKAGLITGYAVYATNARSPSEPDLVLSVSFPNWAALDRSEEFEALAAKVIGDEQTQNKGMIDRGAMREVLGSQMIRELVLK